MAQPTPLSQVPPPPPPQATPPPPPASHATISATGGGTIAQIANRNLAARALDTVAGYAENVAQAESSMWLLDMSVEKIGSLIFFFGVWSVLISIGLSATAFAPDVCGPTGGYLPTWLKQLLSTWGLFTVYGDPQTCSQVFMSLMDNWFGVVTYATGGLYAVYFILDLIIMKWIGDALHPGGKKR